MLAFRLLRHSILQVTGNLGAALTLSVMPLLLAALGTGIGVAARQAFMGGNPPGIAVAAVMLAIVAIFALAFVTLAAPWHRFVLLNERPRVLRPIGKPELRYVGASIRIFLIMLLVGIPVVLLSSALIIALDGNLAAVLVINLLIGFALAVLGLRLGTGLAGAATGAARPLTTGWRATADAFGTLAVLSLLTQVLGLVLNLVAGLPGAAGIVAALLVTWFSALLSLSIITTLWGHFVEGRALR